MSEEITKEQLELLLYKIDSEGFDYCFRNYSSFKKITDVKFRELYNNYIAAANALEKYIKKQAKIKIPESDE